MYKIRILLVAFLLLSNAFSLTAQNKMSDGKASYYSNGLHGRRMSNGERYNRNDFTCAHRTLPFGTRLRVTNPRNGKSVIVRVTDRGPFARGRIIDLSYAAARELGTLAAGVAYVSVEVVPKETEIPFITETKSTIEVPEVEYGAAGICYEFIPEWEKVEDDKPKEIERKVDTRLNRNKDLQQAKIKKETSNDNYKATQPTQQSNKSKTTAVNNHSPQQTKNHQQITTTNKSNSPTTTNKNGSSNSWANFFKRIKDGVSGLFE